MRESPPQDVQQKIESCIRSGRKIEAIKLHRERSGKGLKDAKDEIEALEAEMRARDPDGFATRRGGSGCLTSVALGLLGARGA
jgi:hypothetical protein